MHMNGCDGCLTHARFTPGSGAGRWQAGADAGPALGVARAFSRLPDRSWLSAEPSGRSPWAWEQSWVAFDALQHPDHPPPVKSVKRSDSMLARRRERSRLRRLALFHITPQRRRKIGLYFRREIIVSLFFCHLCFYGHTGRFSQLSVLPSPFPPPPSKRSFNLAVF